jgi:hypothetical protein
LRLFALRGRRFPAAPSGRREDMDEPAVRSYLTV